MIADWRPEASQTLRAVASGMEAMADALDAQDDLLGAIAGIGLAENLPTLPKHIRDTFMEYLDDEAARGVRAELLYMQEHQQ